MAGLIDLKPHAVVPAGAIPAALPNPDLGHWHTLSHAHLQCVRQNPLDRGHLHTRRQLYVTLNPKQIEREQVVSLPHATPVLQMVFADDPIRAVIHLRHGK